MTDSEDDYILVHYAKTKFEPDEIKPEDQPISNKPKGVWYAPDDDWETVLMDMPKTIIKKYKYIYKIELRYTVIDKPDRTKVVIIDDKQDFDKFTIKYGCVNDKSGLLYIKWPVVAMDFGGIEMIPMVDGRVNFLVPEAQELYWKSGLHAQNNWYIGWDIDSGCVWNPKAIKSFEFLGKFDSKKLL